MTVQVWDTDQFYTEALKQADGDILWHNRVLELLQRAHDRGDGVAVYVNHDLSHPEIGAWKVVSYGGPEAQLETRQEPSNPLLQRFTVGEDFIPVGLPDIGGSINWRYSLEAVVPPDGFRAATEQETAGHLAGYTSGGVETEHGLQVPTHDRLVTVQVKVPGGVSEEQAVAVVRSALENGLDVWESSGGECGFADDDLTGTQVLDIVGPGKVEIIDAAVI